MLAPTQPRHSAWANTVLATADRLLTEFETLPIRTVVDAITTSRAALLAETGHVPPADLVESRARERLVPLTAQAPD